jgi:hypothetical protein
VRKSRRRDPSPSDFGTYSIIDMRIGGMLVDRVPLATAETELASIVVSAAN